MQSYNHLSGSILKSLALMLTLMLALMSPTQSMAHDLDFGYLDIEEVEQGRYQFLFRYSSKAFDLSDLNPQLPEGCDVQGFMREGFSAAERTFRWSAICRGTDAQVNALEWVGIDGLPKNQKLFVRYERVDEALIERVVDELPLMISHLTSPAEKQASSHAAFFLLGAEHLLKGYDHLLMVLCFLLLFRRYSTLLWTVSGFTIGHTLSLIAASLGWLKVSIAPVELMIALSVVMLAREIFINSPDASLLRRFPIIVSLGIGLLHGLGFSFALAELGLSEEQKLPAILMFNLGIEFGQLIFIAFTLSTLWVFMRISSVLLKKEKVASELFHNRFRQFTALIIGSISLMWVLQRL